MDSTTYQKRKQKFLQEVMPHKLIAPQELTHVGENIFSLQGIDIEGTADFTNNFDKIIGVGKLHRTVVHEASGETGLANYRNYLNAAINLSNPTPVIIVASPTERKLTNIIPVVEDYITPGIFFDFAEMMIEETGYEIDEIRYDRSDHSKVTISFFNPMAEPRSLGFGENVLTDGFYLTWQPTEVELGHFYIRLVCSNGMTEKAERRDTNLHRLDSSEMQRLISIVKGTPFLNMGVDRFATLIDRANQSRISLSEMHSVQRRLAGLDLQADAVEAIVPYQGVKEMYEAAGMYDSRREHLLKGEGTIWDTYNSLTDFASHNELISETDYRRVKILQEASRLLHRSPDIVTYYDIF